MKNIILRRLLILAFLIVLPIGLIAAGCSQETEEGSHLTEVTMILDWTPNTNHTGLYVAQALGYYENEGLKVNIEQPPEGDSLLFVATGKAPFCISAQESIAAALDLSEPMPVKAVAAVVNHNTSGILSLREKGIDRFRALEGKKYATWGIPIYDAVLRDVVVADGGRFEAVDMVPNNATDTITALQTDFDAVWVFYGWDGIIAELHGLETHYLPFNEGNPDLDYYTPIIAANETYLQDHADEARRFLSATAKGYEYAIDHPEEAARILLEYAPEIGEEIALASQKYLSEQYKADAAVWGVIDQERWDRFFAWMYDAGILTQSLEPGAGLDNSFLSEID